MIRLHQVSKSFMAAGTRKVIVDNVTLSLPKGRSVGLLGRNGAGKSTLLGMIGGSILPDRGRITRDVEVSWPLGFGTSFHQALTGAQNVRFIARIYGVDTDDLLAFVEDFSELGRFIHMPVGTYSSGMKARLAFGVSMGVAFDVYLVDEITAVGDVSFRRKCHAAFQAKLGVADIVMVSHYAEQIREYCDSALVMEEGRLTYYRDLEEGLAAHEINMRG